MEKHIVKVLETFSVTHDVKGFKVEKPKGYSFTPGQATELSINKEEWKDEGRPFTFTNLPEEEILEFIIKIYPSHKGVTNKLKDIKENDEVILHDVFGDISYQGKGVFIAGGAGITPFISILRQLNKDNRLGGNKLIFANKTKKDIICEQELKSFLGNSFINILEEEKKGYHQGRITQDFLKEQIDDLTDKFYICGPPPMMDNVVKNLKNLNVSESNIIYDAW